MEFSWDLINGMKNPFLMGFFMADFLGVLIGVWWVWWVLNGRNVFFFHGFLMRKSRGFWELSSITIHSGANSIFYVCINGFACLDDSGFHVPLCMHVWNINVYQGNPLIDMSGLHGTFTRTYLRGVFMGLDHGSELMGFWMAFEWDFLGFSWDFLWVLKGFLNGI